MHGRRAAGRRRGDHLLRPAADPRADGVGPGVCRRRRAGDSQSGARGRRRRSRARVGSRSSRSTSSCETVRQTRAGLAEQIPLIGFAGAPFTLASYAIEGGGSRNYLHTKTLMYRDAGAWHALDGPAGARGRAVSQRPDRRRRAGVQLFDSWVGCLGAGRLSPLRAAATRKAIIDAHHARRAGDQLRHRQPGLAAAAWPKRAAT